ncbi:hypothetical protein P12x_000729 [Tundrisphaera lichenicola]|uniref:hypothetical protein n=1 Tax=Tundrisphaera lichenicola TaxID=2029860 RepID=UPI003EBE7641
MRLPRFPHRTTGLALASLSILAAIAPGCGEKDEGPALAVETLKIPGDPEINRSIQEGLSEIINQADARYEPLKYEYDEGLLKIADQAEAHLSGKAEGPVPRFMPRLEEAEEQDHFRETIRRWEAQNGKPFRPAIDPLIAEVAGRKPGEAFHPEFHKRFGVVFDSFIPIEVEDAHRRRNRAIWEKADELLAQYRESQPESVRYFEEELSGQYPREAPGADPASKAP